MAYLELKNIKTKNLSINAAISESELITIYGDDNSHKEELLSLFREKHDIFQGEILLCDESLSCTSIAVIDSKLPIMDARKVRKSILRTMDEQDRKKRKELLKTLLKFVTLEGFEKKRTKKLKKDEALLASFAKILASKPKLLVVNDLTAELNEIEKKRVLNILLACNQRLGLTVLYFTDRRDEALGIADRTIILNEGRVEAFGKSEDIYNKPTSPFLAYATGEGTMLPGDLIFEHSHKMLFFRPEECMLSEENIRPDLYPNHLVMNGVKVLSAEFRAPGYMLGVSFKGFPILVYSRFRPAKANLSLLIPQSSIIEF